MNEHLEPIFRIVLPRMQAARIEYWVYGGFGYAAMVGKFYRQEPNGDLDIFVLNDNFEDVEKLLEDLCKQNNWTICKSCIASGRPKLELFIGRKERFSVMPVYKTEKYVEIKSPKGSKKYPLEVLTPVERHLESLTFVTPLDYFLKELLLDYFSSKKKYPRKRIEDARYILTKEEFAKFYPNEDYVQNI